MIGIDHPNGRNIEMNRSEYVGQRIAKKIEGEWRTVFKFEHYGDTGDNRNNANRLERNNLPCKTSGATKM